MIHQISTVDPNTYQVWLQRLTQMQLWGSTTKTMQMILFSMFKEYFRRKHRSHRLFAIANPAVPVPIGQAQFYYAHGEMTEEEIILHNEVMINGGNPDDDPQWHLLPGVQIAINHENHVAGLLTN